MPIPTAPIGWRGGWRRSTTTAWVVSAFPPSQLALMEETNDTDELRAIVERVILADRATKEPSGS